MIVTSYGRKKIRDDDIKKHGRKNSRSDSERQNFTPKPYLQLKPLPFFKPLTQNLPRSDLKFGGTLTTVTKRNKMQQRFLLKTLKKSEIIKIVKTLIG